MTYIQGWNIESTKIRTLTLNNIKKVLNQTQYNKNSNTRTNNSPN